MSAKAKKPTKKKSRVVPFQPGIVTFLIAVIAVLTILLLAYFGVILSV